MMMVVLLLLATECVYFMLLSTNWAMDMQSRSERYFSSTSTDTVTEEGTKALV